MGPDANKEIENIDRFHVLHQNSTLPEAQVILLGDSHTDMGHDIDIQQFINSHIVDGDIVLVEGVAANKKIDSKNYFQTDSISKDVQVYGWDDIGLRDQSASNVRRLIGLKEAIAKAKEEGREEVSQMLTGEFWKLKEVTDQIAIVQRNKSLIKVLAKLSEENPDRKIFIRGGIKHFTDDPALIENLNEKYKYIALKPVFEDTIGREDRVTQYFAGDRNTPTQSNKEAQSVNKVLTIQLPDGSTTLIGAAWFLNGGFVKEGDTVFVDEKIGLESDRRKAKLALGEGYKVISIQK